MTNKMTVRLNSNTQLYSIYNNKESHKNMKFINSYCKMYFNKFGIDIYKNKEEEKTILVLTKSSGNNTPHFYVLDFAIWDNFKDSVENLNEVSSLDAALVKYFDF